MLVKILCDQLLINSRVLKNEHKFNSIVTMKELD